jgi:hypothetical protein
MGKAKEMKSRLQNALNDDSMCLTSNVNSPCSYKAAAFILALVALFH